MATPQEPLKEPLKTIDNSAKVAYDKFMREKGLTLPWGYPLFLAGVSHGLEMAQRAAKQLEPK